MKIKTSEWLGCEFGARNSRLRKGVQLSLMGGLFEGVSDNHITVLGNDQAVDTAVLLTLRLEFVERVCAFENWKHYLITPQAQKMADSLKIDSRFDYNFLRRLPATPTRSRPPPDNSKKFLTRPTFQAAPTRRCAGMKALRLPPQ
jgi:hypothetical protein